MRDKHVQTDQDGRDADRPSYVEPFVALDTRRPPAWWVASKKSQIARAMV
jgi:hypothetical protein